MRLGFKISRTPLSGRLLVVSLALATAATVGLTACGGEGSSEPASAHASDGTIRVDVGMADVRIGMTKGKVRKVLGAPQKETSRTAAFGPGRLVTFHYRKLKVLFWRGAPVTPSGSKPPDRELRVAAMSTERSSEKTKQNVGVGSTEAQVEQKVPGVTCETLRFEGRSWRNCHTGSYTCNPPSWTLGDLPCLKTAFVLKNGRVFRVLVGWLGSPDGTVG